jgi:hypothetical protein
MAANKGNTIKVPSTRADGHKLAVAMLRAMEGRPDECLMLQMFTNVGVNKAGVYEQDNVVLRYLDTLRQAGSRDLEIGFAEVVTDFIASALDNGVARPEAYENNVIPFPKQCAQPSGVSEQ